MKGITPKTEVVLKAISTLDCIKPYTLVGGTALSLTLGTRESEDLDFMSWRQKKDEKREIDWPAIKREIESVCNIEVFDILDIDHIEIVADGVKISFYANPNYSPVKQSKRFINNIKLADPVSIGAMKMEVMLRRSKFRDYYDIYSLLKAGYDINEMISLALKYSNHRLKSKNLLALITNSERFIPETSFMSLNPVYDISPKDIEEEIKKAIDI